MNKYIGRAVTLVCEFIGNNDRNQAVVKASDGAEIIVILPPGETFERCCESKNGFVS